MNSFYHEFVPGFNAWYLFVPLMVLVAAYLGYHKWALDDDDEIREVISDSRIIIFIAVCVVSLFGLISVESMAGIVQWFDNGLLANESPMLSLFGAVITVLGVLGVFALLLYGAVWYFAQRRYNALVDQQRRNRNKRSRKRRLDEDYQASRHGRW